MENQLAKLLCGVYCVSLSDATERRKNASDELSGFGIDRWTWHDGVRADSAEVLEEILSRRVLFSPPCFRCGKEVCACENNFLTFPQIAVCLAYRNLWKRICAESCQESDLFFLCEDDVAFTDRAHEGANYLAHAIEVGTLERRDPLLVRLGWAHGREHNSTKAFGLKANQVKMSNPCYLLNAAMAKKLLDAHVNISHTVDVFTHRDMSQRGGHFTLSPPIAFEHSWSTGRFESAIFPRKAREKYLRRSSSWVDRIKNLLKGGSHPAGSKIRKRFEVSSGLLVLDTVSGFDFFEVRRQLPKGIDLAVLSRDCEWLDRMGDLALTVPEWGMWYRQLGFSSLIADRFMEPLAGSLVFSKADSVSQGWSYASPTDAVPRNLQENALALLRLGGDSTVSFSRVSR